MTLPQKKRGFRRIVVDGDSYEWRYCESRNFPDALVDIRQASHPRSRVLVLVDYQDSHLISEYEAHPYYHPVAFVAHAIREVTRLGWKPEGYKLCSVRYQSRKFMWEDLAT